MLSRSIDTLELSVFLRSGCEGGAFRDLPREAAVGAYKPVLGVLVIAIGGGRTTAAGIRGTGGTLTLEGVFG